MVEELSKEMEDKLEKNIVWVLASRRSGTSWAAKELLSHNTKFMNEPLIGNHISGVMGNNSPYYRRLDERKDKKDYFFSEKFKETWIYFLRKLILNRIYAQFQDVNSVIIIKEPNGSMGADIISEALPNSKIILLLRDGRDVVNSDITRITAGGFAVKSGKAMRVLQHKERLQEIRARAKIWISLMNVLLPSFQKHNEKLRYLVKYEDLRSNTLGELKKLYEFIGIPITDSELSNIVEKFTFENIPDEKKGLGTQRQFAKAGIWKEKFNHKEIEVLEEIMGNQLKQLGYD